MIVSPAGFLVAMMIARQRQEEQDASEKQSRHSGSNILLLEGGSEFMELSGAETLVAVYLGREGSEWSAKWKVSIDNKEFLSNTLSECIQSVLDIYKPKAIQLLPRSTKNGEYHTVIDGYTLLMKVSTLSPETEAFCEKLVNEQSVF